MLLVGVVSAFSVIPIWFLNRRAYVHILEEEALQKYVFAYF